MPGPPVVGGVYLVDDKKIVLLPPEERKLHDRRTVLVLSGPATNADDEWAVVLCCPISGSTNLKTPYCVKLNQGEGNVTKKCWIRVPAIQPLLKRDLEDFSGTIPNEKLKLVHLRLVQYMGLG